MLNDDKSYFLQKLWHKTKKTEIEKFLKENPELKSYITNKEKVIAQYKLMGLKLPKVEIKTKKSGSKKR